MPSFTSVGFSHVVDMVLNISAILSNTISSPYFSYFAFRSSPPALLFFNAFTALLISSLVKGGVIWCGGIAGRVSMSSFVNIFLMWYVMIYAFATSSAVNSPLALCICNRLGLRLD